MSARSNTIALALATAAIAAMPASAIAGGRASIEVLSNRADLISGGKALVAVRPPRGVAPRRLRIRLGRRDVTKAFALRANGRYEGLVSGLKLGRNRLTATVRGSKKRAAAMTITNHPIGGPVFSGPQIQPWVCQKSARDSQCNEPPAFSYLYKPTNSTDLKPYDRNAPPSDVDTTTTDTGRTVPFIVRKETGYQDRNRYRIEVLYEPGQPWTRWTPQRPWNHKLLIMHGGSCSTNFQPSDPPFTDYSGTLPAVPGIPDSSTVGLGRGFAVMSTALDNSGSNCNPALQAESILMAKEHIVESYGDIRYTIGTGCSGGSLAEQWMTNAYPGLYQGLITQCTFPDAVSTGQQILDYALLANYLGVPISGPEAGSVGGVPVGTVLGELAPGRGWTTMQAAAVAGDRIGNAPVSGNWAFSAHSYFSLVTPTGACYSNGLKQEQFYDPSKNPGGVRCGILDWNMNLLGPRHPSVWGTQEKAIGRGFAGIPIDNIGVQYGLGALSSGMISSAQFVDLNANIGGFDIDWQPTSQRMAADERALANAYRTGLINQADNLDQVPIINLAGPNDPGIAHDTYRAFAIRARLDRAHGTHANQVMWQGPAPIIGDPYYTAQALIAMDHWLTAIDADDSRRSLPAKVIADRPSDIHEQCSDGHGDKVSDDLCGQAIVPVYGTPRTVAGEAITTDQNKCRLKPLDRAGYDVTFTDAEWAQLQKVFPTGVCDWSKSGVGQRPVIPWLRYSDSKAKVVYGGRPLGAPPR